MYLHSSLRVHLYVCVRLLIRLYYRLHVHRLLSVCFGVRCHVVVHVRLHPLIFVRDVCDIQRVCVRVSTNVDSGPIYMSPPVASVVSMSLSTSTAVSSPFRRFCTLCTHGVCNDNLFTHGLIPCPAGMNSWTHVPKNYFPWTDAPCPQCF